MMSATDDASHVAEEGQLQGHVPLSRAGVVELTAVGEMGIGRMGRAELGALPGSPRPAYFHPRRPSQARDSIEELRETPSVA